MFLVYAETNKKKSYIKKTFVEVNEIEHARMWIKMNKDVNENEYARMWMSLNKFVVVNKQAMVWL